MPGMQLQLLADLQQGCDICNNFRHKFQNQVDNVEL